MTIPGPLRRHFAENVKNPSKITSFRRKCAFYQHARGGHPPCRRRPIGGGLWASKSHKNPLETHCANTWKKLRQNVAKVGPQRPKTLQKGSPKEHLFRYGVFVDFRRPSRTESWFLVLRRLQNQAKKQKKTLPPKNIAET